MTDYEYLEAKGRLDIDEYAFSERVSIMLGEKVDRHTKEELGKARDSALAGYKVKKED